MGAQIDSLVSQNRNVLARNQVKKYKFTGFFGVDKSLLVQKYAAVRQKCDRNMRQYMLISVPKIYVFLLLFFPQELGGEKRKLSGEAKVLQAKISGLSSQVKDLSLQNSQLERQVLLPLHSVYCT